MNQKIEIKNNLVFCYIRQRHQFLDLCSQIDLQADRLSYRQWPQNFQDVLVAPTSTTQK
jgi:hypothetical protein